MTYPQIEAARALHAEREMYHRRQAMLARITGRDPMPDEVARDHHHRAVVALTREIDATTIRRVA